jgi:ribonucleoside-diphosphate reductase alpha chain
LLKDVQLLLLNLGIRSDIKFYTIRKRGSAQGNLKISGTDYIRFVDLIGFPLAVYKQDKCKEHIQQRVNKGREFIPLKEIHQAEAVCVYDVSEPVTNSLIAEGMIVHNCNLGSINMSRMVTGGRINWHKLEYTIRLAVNFLDNVIDKNKYPLSQIEQITKANRKIGLGMMGWAECLIQLGLPYDSGRAVKLAEKTMSFIQKTAREESTELADKKGNFPNFNKSSLTNKYPKMRNATVTTIAPTGSISIIAGCSSGIEPIFAVSFVRHILEGTKLFEVNPLFEKAAKERGFYSDSLLRKIARTGSLQHIRGIPPDIKRIFKTAFDINPEWHVRMQAAFQRYTDNAVSKTVNLSQNAAFNDVKKSFELAYRMKCKGITVYRYGSKPQQVLYIGKPKKHITAHAEYAGGCPGVCTN